MSPPRRRVQTCDRGDARHRLTQARKFLEVAEIVATEDLPESSGCAAALAVLAGIAAADAACCAVLGERSRSEDHRDAEDLLRRIDPDGPAAAAHLRRILGEKDSAHYGLTRIGGQRLAALIRQAGHMVAFAEATVRRSV